MTGRDWACTRCQTENEAWRGWCQQCGHPQGETQTAAASPSPAVARPESAGGGRRPLVIAVVIAVLVVALGAFALTRGGDSKKPIAATSGSAAAESTTTTIAVRSAAQVAADEATAHGVVVQAGDLGPLWTAAATDSPLDVSPFMLTSDADFVSCMGLSPRATGGDTPTDVASDDLSDGQRAVSGEVTMYANERAAKDDFELLSNRSLMSCIAHVLDTAVAEELSGAGLPPEVKTGNAVVSDFHVGNVHTDAVGIRALIPIQALQFSARTQWDLVFAHTGRTITVVSFLTNVEAFPVNFELAVVNTVVDRLPKS